MKTPRYKQLIDYLKPKSKKDIIADMQKLSARELGDELCTICYHGDTSYIKLCLDYGANINFKDKDGWTPLMYACFNNKIEVVKLLIKYGVNINVRNAAGRTALDKCDYKLYGSEKHVLYNLLRQHGAKLEQELIIEIKKEITN